MKRILSALLAVVMIFGCAACADFFEIRDKGDKPDNTAEEIQVIADVTVAPAVTAVPTPEPSAEATEPEPSATPEGTAALEVTETPEPTEAAETPEPSETAEASSTPTPAPSATAAATATPKPTASPTAAATATPKPTAAPTAAPTPAMTPKPTPIPTAAPTPVPGGDGSITFSPNSSLPLPSLNEDVPYGQPFCFGGIVRCSNPILSVTAVITNSSGSTVTSKSVNFDASANKTSVELVDRTFPKEGNNSLTYKVKFEQLSTGTYNFFLYAEAVGTGTVLLRSSQFKVVNPEWRQLISNNLRNNYSWALSFFGSRDQFMFRYKWADNRNITVESSWMNTHFSTVTTPAGKSWYVHKLAVPKFNQAINYMNTSYVRVSGAGYDSGVIKLWSLVSTFDGTLNTRFVTDRTFVSHHSFGTAIDLNASMSVNQNVLSNRQLIRSEVGDHLVYNGIKTSNGVSYYDFTYNGSCSTHYKNVPTTVINYLLYELAFYRAGFNWGYYYDHGCDGMHFALSEYDPNIHNTSSRSLRKVWSYIG